MAAVGALMLAGCAGPLDGERGGFDGWADRDAPVRYVLAERRGGNGGGGGGALPEAPTLADYLRYAAEHNPGLEAAFEDWQAAVERVPQARALADPQLSYRYVIHAMNERQAVGLSQAIPWYGRLRARGDAGAQAEAAAHRFDAALLELRYEVKQAWAAYAYLARALAVMRENAAVAGELEAAARARFEAGEGTWADVVQASLGRERIEDEIATFEARRGPTVARLNAALGRPAELELPWPGEAIEAEEAALLARLGEANPELAALSRETASARHGVRVARLNRVPDVTLGAEYMQMPGERDMVGLMASVNLPIWAGRTRAERAEALAGFGAAAARRVDRRHVLGAELRLALSTYRDGVRRVELYDETLIPMAREALEASEAAYAQGAVAFEAMARGERFGEPVDDAPRVPHDHAGHAVDAREVDAALAAWAAEAFEQYLTLVAALAGDEFDAAHAAVVAYHDHLLAVDVEPLDEAQREAWQAVDAELHAALHAMAAADELEGVREHLEHLSDYTALVVTAFAAEQVASAYWLHCPMAFDNRGADWLQADEQVANPYFGESMLRCGEVTGDLLADDDADDAEAPAHDHAGHADDDDDYPLDVCVVSGLSLDAMGGPVSYDHQGREVRFCCAACVPDFEDDPERYLAKLDEPKGGDD